MSDFIAENGEQDIVEIVPGKCTMCERVFAISGIIMGVILLFVGADILLNGRITKTISRAPEIEDEQ